MSSSHILKNTVMNYFFISLFLLSIAGILYPSIGYLILLRIVSHFRQYPVKKGELTPLVSIIIAAHNEEKHIAKKIENTLNLDYPRDKLEIIVFSDASTDGTNEIVRSYAEQGVILNDLKIRKGKTGGQNESVKISHGEIIVFSDATTHYHEDAVRQLVRNFADNNVGCVGGALEYKNRSEKSVGQGGNRYWQYEKEIKTLESTIGSLIGVSGCMYAVRKNLYRNIDPDLISDFVIALNTVKMGYRVIYEPNAVCEEDTEDKIRHELRMRIRVAVRSYKGLFSCKELLNPIKYGFFSMQLLSHKLMRYCVPFFMLLAFLSNLLLLDILIFQISMGSQIIFYNLAIIGYLTRRSVTNIPLFFYPFFYCLLNLAALIAWRDFILGKTQPIWEPSR